MSKVGIIMGSSSDLSVMKAAKEFLDDFGIENELQILSAHRTPKQMLDFAEKAQDNGFSVLIAGAGGAAHLPGMLASATTLAVIGVPVKSSNSLDGWDSLLSIAQMPNGVPVATVAVNAALNAAILAVQILAVSSDELKTKLLDYKKALIQKVEKQRVDLQS
ncbi:MAG: 5-(carboxyamino)imidazole ribonucleotide mutase [Bdellovibrionales bacterium]|nr:5-(carboxyamino)imidazole ribonucleotide mutase [Bdellovibrionales bacterium]